MKKCTMGGCEFPCIRELCPYYNSSKTSKPQDDDNYADDKLDSQLSGEKEN